MSLLFGIVAGLCYGLSAFSGAFISIPLLVLVVGMTFHQALPVALFTLGIMAAVAAGDGVRARQIDTRRASLMIAGALPTVLVGGWLVHLLSHTLLVTLFLMAAIVFGPLLLYRSCYTRERRNTGPAALLHAPKRPMARVAEPEDLTLGQRFRLMAAGAGCGGLAALSAAPGSGVAWRVLDRQLPGQVFAVSGTLAFAVAIIATLGAGLQMVWARGVPGYDAGLYVLGGMAGIGIARRVFAWRRIGEHAQPVVAVMVVLAAIMLWTTCMPGLSTAS